MTVVQVSFLIAGAGATWYPATVAVTVLIFALAPTPERRRDARKVSRSFFRPLNRPLNGVTGVSTDLSQYVVGDVEVGVDVLHVVAVFQRVDQLENLAGGVSVQRGARRGQEAGVGGVVVDAAAL